MKNTPWKPSKIDSHLEAMRRGIGGHSISAAMRLTTDWQGIFLHPQFIF